MPSTPFRVPLGWTSYESHSLSFGRLLPVFFSQHPKSVEVTRTASRCTVCSTTASLGSKVRWHTLSQFDSTHEGGVSIQGHVGCRTRDQQLQLVPDLQLHNTWRMQMYTSDLELAFSFFSCHEQLSHIPNYWHTFAATPQTHTLESLTKVQDTLVDLP